MAEFTVSEGQRVPFSLTWFPASEEPPRPVDAGYAIQDTELWWTDWSSQCTYVGDHRDAVVRSLITLKALTYEPTGGIVAAATTSLPETLGGSRNWDYRFCWLRDATLTLESLMRGGFYRGGHGVAKLAPAGDGRRSVPAADHVRGGRRAPAGRVGDRLAPRLRGVGAGAHRQRRSRPVPAGRLRRGHVRAVRVLQTRRTTPTSRPWEFQLALMEFLEGRLARAGRRHLGGPGPAAPLHPLQGHGLGGHRPRHQDRRGVRPRRTRRPSGRRSARRSTTRSATRASTPTRVRSPSTTAPTSSTPAC